MLTLLAPLVLLAAGPAVEYDGSKCPTDETAMGRRRILLGEPSCADLAKRAIPPRNVTAAEQRRVIAYFDDVLVDGPSARWRWGKVVRGSIVCGQVNAKNRMGGYSGWAPFSFDLETARGSMIGDFVAALGGESPCA